MSGTARESVVREAFKSLLKGWGKSKDLIFVPEYEYKTTADERRYVDGALLHTLRVPFGYWEAKDEKDDLDDEIELKFRRGYPQDNIVFEDSRQAVLIQNKRQVMRCGVDDVSELEKLLGLFFRYERKEIADFRNAVEQFKKDLPHVLRALREMIERAHGDNVEFREGSAHFLKHAQETINPNVTPADVREMLIQHMLTEEIFSHVFGSSDFHRQNNVAKQLYGLEETFFTGGLKHKTLEGLRPYYAAIKSAAALVSSHHEKQKFLKVIYEGFYKVYNKKAADRLGVVYTPNEIVRFMIESANWLCHKHFAKQLIDKDVEILDPAVGTGTYIAELIEYFRGQPAQLRRKYLTELHCNEVAILPYYVANLNIEATYAALMKEYEEYPNLCFVDTLDNTAALYLQKGQQGDLFGAVSEENIARIKRQNKKKISVIIGNPPYNANQLNENENNKNREYPEIDGRIKDTYIAESTAQKTKLYDMYARFFRWASDRIDGNGIIAFVSNSSFIDSRTYDGFRKIVSSEFNEIWIIDMKGNARTSGDRRRQEGGNVFDDQIRVGVAIYFCIKKRGLKGCRIRYEAVADHAKSEAKLDFVSGKQLSERTFLEIVPDNNGNWINQVDNDFDTLIPVADKKTKAVKIAEQERAIFKTFSFGVVTNRDEWVYAENDLSLKRKVQFLISTYNKDRQRLQSVRDRKERTELLDTSIKWTRAVKHDLEKAVIYKFDETRVTEALYRPYSKRSLYFSPQLNEMQYRTPEFFGPRGQFKNPSLVFTDPTSQKPFMILATNVCPDMHLVGAAAGSVILARSASGERPIENVTDWALGKFRSHYASEVKKSITKEAIFEYVYGVLHDPIYREKYSQNLKREFPRIPFYSDFWRWSKWGRELIALHINYASIQPWPLRRINVRDEKSRKANLAPKPILRANMNAGMLEIDSETNLVDVPAEAWTYELGNRSALEWILDQHKEKTPKDQSIREKFNTYDFTEHKEHVIDLLTRVVRVSVETMRIVSDMRTAHR